MKGLFKLFILSSLVMAGCTKISTETSRENLQPMTFSAMVSDEPDAKAAVDGLDIKWSEGDEIGIFDGFAVRRFTLKSGAGTTSAVFEGEAAEAESYVAVYPYDENIAVSDGKVTGLSLPSIQTAGSCPVIMTAECKDGGNAFAFKSAIAYVKVTPEFDCHKIVFETHAPSMLCGDLELAPDIFDSVPHASVIGNSKSHALLSGEIKTGNSYYIGVSPIALLKGFSIVFDALEDNLQYVMTRSANKDGSYVKLVRGHVLNFGKFTLELSKWTERNEYLAPYGPYDPVHSELLDDRAVYDWKDVTRIADQSQKIGAKQQQIHFMEDIDFGGRTLNTQTLNNDGFVNIEGDGHKIFNYRQGSVDDGGDRYAGLFYVKKLRGITFDSLTLCPEKFDLSHDDDIYAGAFISRGYVSSLYISFDKCSVSGDIKVSCTGTTSEAYAGGFCGMVECEGKSSLSDHDVYVSVYECLMDGSVTADSEHDMAYAGGFIAFMDASHKSFECNISRCRNRAAIRAEGDDDYSPVSTDQGGISAGGMLGCDRDCAFHGDIVLKLNSCVNEGSVSAIAKDNDNSFAGGMVGCHDSDGKSDTEETLPSVNNSLNRGSITVKGGKGWIGTTAGLAGGMIGYCYSGKTSFSNCVDDGDLTSDDICAHISGANGSYDSDKNYPCYWTREDSHAGIHKNGDKGGYKPDLKASDMKGDFYRDYVAWTTTEGHLDIDIVR